MAETAPGPRPGPDEPPQPTGPTGATGPTAPDPLATLVGALSQAGLDPAATELADALWLARWSRPTAPGPPGDPTGTTGHGTEPTPPPGYLPRLDGTDGRGTRLVPPTEPVDDTMISLYPGAGTQTRGRAPAGAAALGVAVPEAAALPRLLELQAALRPLQRYRSPARPRREVLDEPATAERSARAAGLLLPVFAPVSRGDAAMQLLMDASSSMYVWERMLRELGGVFERLGAFHEVQVRYLHATPEGEPSVSGRFDPEPAGLRSADQLSDPTGRRVTLLVSDCAGPLWRSGQAHRLLYRLARHGPVAVLQPLPARLWSRTRLPVSYGVLHRAEGVPCGALRFSAGAAGYAGAPDATPVPVLPPTAQALGAWARLLAGMGAGEVPAAVGWVRPDQPPTHSAPRRASVPASALVAGFRSAASPAAAQLAVYLAAAPLFLPVMQLVQRTMLPDSGPAELAEVLLGGLVVRAKGDDHRWYEFADGVRDVLLGPLGRDEALLVLKHCSEYVEQRFGKSGPNFPALAITQLTDGPGDPVADDAVRSAVQRAARATAVREAGRAEEAVAVVTESPQPFAEVAARVLERFMPLPENGGQERDRGAAAPGRSSQVVRRARELVARFTEDGMVQNLVNAVNLLRSAATQERVRGLDPELWGELAQQLITLWRLRGGTDLLREAQEAAATAAAPGSPAARAVRGRVFQAAAEERAAAGDDRGALELLRRADREFTAVCAAPGLAAADQLGATLERAQVLEDQWLLSGDTGLLQETVGILEAFADSWAPADPPPSGLSLAYGRALLRLAGTAVRDPERAGVYAEQAAASFAAALDALEREEAEPEARIAATLSLVDAQLLAGDRLPEARRLVDRALAETRDGPQRSALLARAGRICVARHAAGGPPGELEAAAERFAAARLLTSRDQPEYSDLAAEWGAALLARAELPGGEPFVNHAVLVLRDCRMETAESDPQLPERLLMLGRALVLRYRAERALVDLREAEHVLGLAERPAEEPAQRARIWYELGESHRLGYGHTHRAERLDHAADAYRKAAEAAATAVRQAPDPQPMLRLSALAHHWRGVVYESARRPRAAAEAYRAALAEWRRLPDGGGPPAADTADRLAELGRRA
jgi:tetratricopeptide (TPR) repeat protein